MFRDFSFTEEGQRKFVDAITDGALIYSRFKVGEIAASLGDEHEKLWSTILSLESARMDRRRTQGGKGIYGETSSGDSEERRLLGSLGTGYVESPIAVFRRVYKYLDKGAESIVFDTGCGTVTKVRKISSRAIDDVIDELSKIVYHNYLFPGTRYTLEDIIRHEYDGYYDLYLIINQQFVTPKTVDGIIVNPTEEQIAQAIRALPQNFYMMGLCDDEGDEDCDSDETESEYEVSGIKNVAYNSQFAIYDFKPGRNTFIDAETGELRFIDPRIDINDPGAGFAYSRHGKRKKCSGDVLFSTFEFD